MIRQFFKDSVLYGLSSIIVQGVPILVLPVYVRLLSPPEYGALEIIAIFAAFINIAVALEIAQGFARYYPEAQTEDEKRAYTSTALWFTIAAYGLFVFLGLSFAPTLNRWILHDTSWEQTVRMAVIATGLSGIYQLLLNQLRWQLKPLAYIAASMAYVLLSVAAGIYFMFAYRTGIASIFYGQIIGAIVAGCCAAIAGRSHLGLTFDGTKCREMLRFSIPLIMSSISVILAGYIDRIAIQNFMTLRDVGLYTAGFRVASIANVMMAGIYFSLTPLVYRNYRKTSTPGELASIFNYFLCGTLPVLMAMSLFSGEMLRLFTTPVYFSAWKIIPVLAIATVCSRLYIFAPGLDIEKKTPLIALINIVSALLNISLNVVLIPYWGILGSALATLCSAAMLFSAYMLMSQRLYPIPFPWKQIAPACLCTLLVIALGYVVSALSPHINAMLFAGKALLIIVASTWIIRLLLAKKSLSS